MLKHTSGLELNWKTLYERRQFRRAITTYKSLYKLSPPYLHNLFSFNLLSKGGNSDKLSLTNWFKNSLIYRSIIFWNSLDRVTRHASSISCFISHHFNHIRFVMLLYYISLLFFYFFLFSLLCFVLFCIPVYFRPGRSAFLDETSLIK